MIVKIIINFLLIISLGILQIAFISGLPGWLNDINLYLAALIFILGFASFNFAAWWAIGAGLMLELFSFLPYGIFLVGLFLTIIITNFLLNYFFTNRSLYSFLALVSLSTLIYEIIVNLMLLIFSETYGGSLFASLNSWIIILEKIAVNLILTLVVYYLIHFLLRNLRPVFLIKK